LGQTEFMIFLEIPHKKRQKKTHTPNTI